MAFERALAEKHERAAYLPLGHSAGGRPLGAIRLGLGDDPPAAGGRRLRILLVGSQHGTEPSGSEALQVLARQVASGERAGYLQDLRLVVFADANPDGRAAHRRVNARDVNLSTNYGVASEPETAAVVELVARWRPDVVVDVHESAILKHRSLGRQGYLTDFESQIEGPTNPNVDPGLLALNRRLVAAAVARVAGAGIPAQRYLGEITDVAQPITHGGLSVRNLRNLAGMSGALAFLLENRLDPPGAAFATPRNIRERVEKQLAGVTALLDLCRTHRREILEAVRAARRRWRQRDPAPVYLEARYRLNPMRPEIVVPLRRIADGRQESRRFAFHDVVAPGALLELPLAYAITADQDEVERLLARHGIASARLTGPRPARVTRQRVVARTRPLPTRLGSPIVYELAARETPMTLPTGTLWIPLDQPAERLIPLLLEPRSEGSIFQHPAFEARARIGAELFVYRVAPP